MEGTHQDSHVRNQWPWFDLINWWPIPLIPIAVVAIRFPGVWAQIGSLLWIPAGLGLATVLIRRHGELRSSISVALFGSFLTYSALSILWSPAPARGLRFVALLGVAFLAFLYGKVFGPPSGGSQMWRAGCIGIAVVLAGLVLVTKPGNVEHLNPDRILAMGVIALTVMAWYGPRSRVYTLCVGLVGVGAILISGSRTASIVMILLLLTARGLRIPWAGRLVLAGSVVALLALFSLTPGFQDRWFQSGEGDLLGILSMNDVQTSGRTDVWPVIADSCHHTVLGEGAGASDSYAFAANQGFPEPHNEYLRIWCDTGWVGSVLFWSFVAAIGLQALRGMRSSRRVWSHPAAAQMVGALLLLSLTDNPLTTAAPFMIPAALAFGWSEHDHLMGDAGLEGPRHLKLPRIKPTGRP